jgi:rare lipoprotein A
MYALTAAHRTLPFGTLLRVRSLVNGSEVDVRVNDRGPFIPGVVIDLSKSAAEAIGLLGLGIKDVSLTVVGADETAQAVPTPYSAAHGSGASVKPVQQRRTVSPVKRRPPIKPAKKPIKRK